MQWSQEAYRLDKVTNIFGLPCVVRLEEGYLPPDEAEEFAQGDIITLDTEIPSDKVGAYFIQVDEKEPDKKASNTPDYGILSSDTQEVFLPYSYDGKLRVLKKIAKVHNVKELADIFPGYSELEGKLSIKTNKDESVTLPKGTTIELDRTIPGSNSVPDMLVIKFEHSKQEKVAAIPYTMKGKFRTKADLKKYNIKEAIERYGLPIDVKFISDEIRKKFYQEVKEGRRKLASVTATLRLNRIVKQRVMVGHYKPISDGDKAEGSEDNGEKKIENAGAEKTDGNEVESENESKDVRKRTVVVIPVDNPEIGEIPVKVCEGDVLTIYESLVNIQSVTEARDMVTQTLCLDFEVKPGMKLLTANEENARKYENVKHETAKPPPLPSRPEHQRPITSAFERADATDPRKKQPPILEESESPDDYLMPITKRPLKGLGDYVDMTGTSGNKVAVYERPAVPPRKPTEVLLPTKQHDSGKKEKGKKDKKHFWQKSVKSHESQEKPKQSQEKPKPEEKKQKPPMPVPPFNLFTEDDGLDGYEEIQKTARLPGSQQIENRPPKPIPKSPSADLGEYEDIIDLSRDSGRKADKNLSGYDEIEEVLALHVKSPKTTEQPTVKETLHTNDSDEAMDEPKSSTSDSLSSVHSSQSNDGTGSVKNTESDTQNANAKVASKSKPRYTNNKLFQDLNSEELVERLILCNLCDLAEICKEEKLDGAFFTDENPESLKDAFGLQGLKLAKFLKMRDENWVTK